MRHAVELNHVAECEHLRARRPVGLCWLHPVTPSGVALYRSARGAPLAVRSRLARVKVRSRRRRALCGGSALRCRPVETSPTPSVSTIYIVVSIRGRVKHPRHLFCTICPDSALRAVHQRLERACAVLSPRCRRARPLVSARGRSCRPRTAPAGPQPPRGRALDRSYAHTRCRCSPPLTCARQPTGAPAARRRRVGERPRMTRCRCRGARGCPCPLRHSVRRPVGPSTLPPHRPERRLGRDLAPPGSRSDPRQSAAGTAPRLRSGADPPLSGLLRPGEPSSTPRERPRPVRRRRLHRPAAPLSAPGGATSTPWRAPGAAPRPCSAHQRPAGARSGLRRRA